MTDSGVNCFGSVSMSFGNPSGHSSFVAAFYTSIVLVLFGQRKVDRAGINTESDSSYLFEDSGSIESRRKARQKSRLIINICKILFIVLCLTIIGLVGFARIILGAHAIN